MWRKLVRWLAREDIEYLEYENRELRYEVQRWVHRHEGAMDALRVFEKRSWYMEQTILDSARLNPLQPTILKDLKP